MSVRKIVQIDESRCDGCGQCIPSCAEGAIQVINGKARLVSDVHCDGLGACLGHCPQEAITLIEREAEPFDEAVVHHHATAVVPTLEHPALGNGCPGSAARQLRLNVLENVRSASPQSAMGRQSGPRSEERPSRLGNWPVQLQLLPESAPFLKNADLLLVADCVPFACADFHQRFLDGRPVAVGCPKLDDLQGYIRKLTRIIRQAGLRQITVVHMEVPCCLGLVHIARKAVEASGRDIPVTHTTISLHGTVLEPA
jgi:ferredoxin